jgi:CubicO group peptidase (beta-lactamase class C family)
MVKNDLCIATANVACPLREAISWSDGLLASSTPKALRDEISAYLKSSTRCFCFPTLSFSLILDGHRIRRFATPDLVDANTIYKVGSLTKLVTAIATLILIEEGTVNLEDPVSRHLPWFRRSHGSNAGVSATVRDLLLHTAGLPRGNLLASNPSSSEVRQYVEDLDPSLEKPRVPKSVKYSNLGYILLGQIIETAAQEAYAEFVTRRILVPLGLEHSGFGTPPARFSMATPHQLVCFRKSNLSPYDCRPTILKPAPYAAMDLFSTGADFSRLLSCLINEGRCAGVRVLRLESIATLFSTRYPIDGRLSSGLGFCVVQTPDGDVFLENAEHFGHSASILLMPRHRFGLVAMTNRASAALDLSHVLGTIRRFLQKGKKAELLTHDYHRPEELVGEYTSACGSVLKVISEGAGLYAAVGLEKKSRLVYKGQDCFLKPTGRRSQYVLRIDRESKRVRGLSSGPIYFVRHPDSEHSTTKSEHSMVVGIYQNATAGRLALYERNRHLILAFSPFKEAILEQISPTVYVQRTGPFVHEELSVDTSKKTLRLGTMTFLKTDEYY